MPSDEQDVAECLLLTIEQGRDVYRALLRSKSLSMADRDFFLRALESAERHGRAELLVVIKRG